MPVVFSQYGAADAETVEQNGRALVYTHGIHRACGLNDSKQWRENPVETHEKRAFFL
jgi:hypothetical protein